MKTVFMFSGQGAQYAGMGKELYRNYAVAKDIFDRADAVLGYSIKDICFQDEKKLGETEYAQPAILTMSIAAMKVLEEQGVRANMTAGLSLGEYSAYVASGAMDFEEAVALVQKRGRFMTEAVPSGEGAMYAIIGLDQDLVEEACDEATALGMGLAVPANYNAPGQIVIAGKTEAVAKAAELAKQAGARRCIPLKVSGPFHTRLMAPAGDALAKRFAAEPFGEMSVPVLFNCLGREKAESDSIPALLVRQGQSSVYMEDTLHRLGELGVDHILEVGPGNALSGFVKKTLPGVTCVSVETPAQLDTVLNAWKEEQ